MMRHIMGTKIELLFLSSNLRRFKHIRRACSINAGTSLLNVALSSGVATDYGCFFEFVDTDISVSTAVVCGIAITVIGSATAGR